MEYKGYIAEVEFDDLEGVYCGHIVNSGPYSIVTFESEDEEQLYREFCVSVDIYLESCQEDGVEPQKPLIVNS
jgi:predicted HicB family RNase H-like nuclease